MKKTINLILGSLVVLYSLLSILFPAFRENYVGSVCFFSVTSFFLLSVGSSYVKLAKNKDLFLYVTILLFAAVGSALVASLYIKDSLMQDVTSLFSLVSFVFYLYMRFFVAPKAKTITD